MAGVNGLGIGPLTANAGTLDLAGFSQTVGSFLGRCRHDLEQQRRAAATLSAGAGGGTYSGMIADNDGVHTGGSVAVNVTNAGGELTLAGPNTYSGGTTVSGGTLNLVNTTRSAAAG